MASVRASLHGPNRSGVRLFRAAGGKDGGDDDGVGDGGGRNVATGGERIPFRIRSLERRRQTGGFIDHDNADDDGNNRNAALFTVRGRRHRRGRGEEGGGENGSGRALLRAHRRMVGGDSNDDDDDDPILIHFHEVPVFIARAAPLYADDDSRSSSMDELYLSEAQRFDHRVCEDSVAYVTCLSRPDDDDPPTDDYSPLSAVGVEVRLRRSGKKNVRRRKRKGVACVDDRVVAEVDARDVVRALAGSTRSSVLTVDESIVLSVPVVRRRRRVGLVVRGAEDEEVEGQPGGEDDDDGGGDEDNEEEEDDDDGEVTEVHIEEIVCRVSGVRIDNDDGTIENSEPTSAAEAAMDEPRRGRIVDATEFFAAAPHADDDGGWSRFRVLRSRTLPEPSLPPDVIHVTTSDLEWFPVRRALLAPCLTLTRFVQAGRGVYADDPVPGLDDGERSEDAPVGDGRPHCRVELDCATFDRVLVFLTSLLFPATASTNGGHDEKDAGGSSSSSSPPPPTFALELTETNALARAADALGLVELKDLVDAKVSDFRSRVRTDSYFRLAEVRRRNASESGGSELLLILDGMILDVTRWIDHHPGGPSIIPTRALDVECDTMFETYHASRASFLYLKSLYVGELHPDDRVGLPRRDGGGAGPTEGFVRSLRKHTSGWRATPGRTDEKVHKSL